jgi:glycosyltransferase involved in cell wall biosynthesis
MPATAAIIIAARNEAGAIGDTLRTLAQQGGLDRVVVVIGVNGTSDDTAQVIRDGQPWGENLEVEVLELAEGNKPRAINAAETRARSLCPDADMWVYMDADTVLAKDTLASLAEAIAVPTPRVAAPHKGLLPSRSWVVNFCARAWLQLPWVQGDVVGSGIYATNQAGRARWGEYPDVVADDGFAAWQFTPEERVIVAPVARVRWPQSVGGLLRAQRRWIDGARQLADSPHCPPHGPAWSGRQRLRAMLSPRVFAAALAVRVMRVATKLFAPATLRAGWDTDR